MILEKRNPRMMASFFCLHVIIILGDDHMKKTENQKLNFNTYFKNAGIAIIAFVVYFGISLFEEPFLTLFGLHLDQLSAGVKIFYMVVCNLLLLASMMLLFHEKLERDFKDLLKHHKEYYGEYFKYWLIALAIMMISNMILSSIANGQLPNNEQAIRDAFGINPFYVYFSAVFLAPVVEELLFRQGIRNLIPNKIAFILVSGIVFGGMHVVLSMTSGFDLLYLIPYCTPGIVFAYMLAKTDNIFVSMGFHFMHNGILMALQFIVLFFG